LKGCEEVSEGTVRVREGRDDESRVEGNRVKILMVFLTIILILVLVTYQSSYNKNGGIVGRSGDKEQEGNVNFGHDLSMLE